MNQRVQHRGELITLVVCCTALFMTTLDATILNVALPSIQRHLHAPPSGLQWTVNGYTLLRASSLFVCGSVADRFGRKRMFSAGLVLFTAGSLACGLAPNLGMLIAFRCFQGFGSAVLTPSSLAIITNTFTDPQRRSWAIGMWNAATGVSSTAGPIIGGVLVQWFGWRAVFLVNIPVGIAALAGTRALRESKSPTPRPFDLPGQLAIAAGLFSLTYALIEGPGHGWLSPLILGLFAVSVLCWLGFVVIQRTSPHPLIDLRYLASPALSGAALLAIFAFTVTSGFQFLNTLYLQNLRGFSPLHAGLLALPITLMVLVFAPVSGRLTGTRGPRLTAVLAMLFLTAGMAVLAAVGGSATPLLLLIVVFLLIGIGNGFVNVPITTAAISSMPRERAAVAGAVGTTGRQTGSSLGVALIGSIVFSVASLNGGVSASALRAPQAAADFVHAMRVGNLVALLLAVVGIFVAMWAFRADTLRPAYDEDSADDPGAQPAPPRS